MNSEASATAQRLHPVAMLIGALKTIRQWVSAFIIPGIAFLASRGFDALTIALLMLGVLVVAALAALWGYLSWRATTYAVSGGAFRLRRGVIQKSERTIPLEHVHSVDTVQGVIQRVFGVVEVRVESAGGGSGQPDASLSALSRGAAEALRREIESSRREAVGDEEERGPQVIRRLGTRDLLVAGATSGQIGVALSLIAVVSQFADEFFSESFAQRLVETLAPRSVTVVIVLAFGAGLLAWLLSIGGTVLAYMGFTLSRDGDYLYIRRGLLERREATIPLSRIQAVRIVEGVLRQPFGLAMLRVESAGYGENAGVSTTLFPLLPRRETQKLLQDSVPDLAIASPLETLPARALRRYVFRATVPAVFLAVAAALVSVSVFDFAAGGALAALLLVPAGLYGWLSYRDAGWAFASDCLVARFRRLARTTAITPRRRIQSRSVVRSPFQRRARLATLQAQVASGGGGVEFQVVDLEADTAEELIGALSSRPEWSSA